MKSNNRTRFSFKKGKVVDGLSEYPDHKKKKDCIYADGVIQHAAHGTYKILCDNDIEVLGKSSMLDYRKVSLLVGDRVTVEIPALSLSPDDRVKGRVVFRYRT